MKKLLIACLLVIFGSCAERPGSNASVEGGRESSSVLSSAASSSGNQAAPGTVESNRPAELDKALATKVLIAPEAGEFTIFYYRPDSNYTGWNLWLWTSAKGGAKYNFTGVTNGIAFFRTNQAVFFDSSVRTLNLIVRTDGWAKDPGPDQSFCIDDCPAAMVLSGNVNVLPVAESWPRIFSAKLSEISPGNCRIRVSLGSRYALPFQPGPGGFAIDGGLVITDALPWAAGTNGAGRSNNYCSDIQLIWSGTPGRTNVYTLSHPSFSNRVQLTFAALPEDAPPLTLGVWSNLPAPVLDEHPDWTNLYWAAWRFMHEKITAGNPANGFEPSYIDEGFNENIYQWDSCFMTAYSMYGRDAFPAMAALDNFYNHQDANGYICRCYNENTGLATGPNDINPPLFAWMEWRWYRLTGDTTRLSRVIPVLDRYFGWVKTNARDAGGHGLYYITDLGCGMDNSPRESYIGRASWIDLSSQQALAAICLSRLAGAMGDTAASNRFAAEYLEIKTNVNEWLWNETNGTYYDRKAGGNWHIRNTIANFWPMVAEVADETRAAALISGHLKNPAEFYRPHLFPTLAANDPVYDGRGHYWRGGVWAPTDFAVIKGLEKFDPAFAFEAATNHIGAMSRVYRSFDPTAYPYAMPSISEPNIARNGDGANQIWESYSPDYDAPGTRWDKTLLVRQKFCGWSGAGPVALLIENVLGFGFDAPANTVTWRMTLSGRHGVQNLRFGNGTLSLVASERQQNGSFTVSASASLPFRLVLLSGITGAALYDGTVGAGSSQFLVQP